MKCTLQGCPGHYEQRLIIHTVKHAHHVRVFDDVPAQVCDVCSDTLLSPDTIRHLEALMRSNAAPKAQAPVYAFT